MRYRGSTGCEDAASAATFVEDLRSQIRRENASSIDATGNRMRQKPDIKWVDGLELYRATKAIHHDSYATDRGQLAWLTQAMEPNALLASIELSDLIKYRRRRALCKGQQGKPLSGSTLNREIELARRVWRWLRVEGYNVGEEPVWRDAIAKHEEVERVRELTTAEEMALWGKLKDSAPDLLTLVEFALLSGQRKAAIVRLQWNDIDIPARAMFVTLKGKGKKKRRHRVKLTARMVEILESLPKVSTRVFTYVCERDAPKRGDRAARFKGNRYPFSYAGWTNKWKKALADAGIEDFRFHDLRHTRATRVGRASGNLKIVQELLGHTEISTTARYVHICDEDMEAAMEKAESTSRGLKKASAKL